ncbi:MAG: Na(+)/H(+) antiporter subunit D [Deltaproteobacteria bacterium]|nr:Na(+)/H(+) antiporter subunit D [Deltaproteobacteria bacterium]
MSPLLSVPVCSPAVIFILGGLMIPLVKGRLKSVWMLALPIAAFAILLMIPEGKHWGVGFLDYTLILGNVDRLSRAFGIIFTIVTFIAVLFALKVKEDSQHMAGFIYAGSALGVVFAGDLFTLYVFWELMAIASTFLILARRTAAARAAAYRYILVHIAGGLFLLAGMVLHYQSVGSLLISPLALESLPGILIFIGVAVNAAIPPLHPWLQDAYPEATVTGAVFLSAFTTKSAVYVMARIYPGAELLIWLGALMTAFPIFYAVLENDIRRVLSYSLMNQVGFMMVGVGIGTPLAINGTVAHAFCHILYKALLFMSTGAVLHQTGKIRCTDLGGLYKTMPLTCLFCMIGSASISAFPLFSGFVSKSMIISAAGHHHLVAVWLILQFASAGVVDHAGIKVPFFTFFAHDSGLRPTEPPANMLTAMGLAAFLCIAICIYPHPLYRILPNPDAAYIPYTAAHVIGQLQLLMFGALAFCLLILSGFYPAELRALNLDTDWFYRRGFAWLYRMADRGFNNLNRVCNKLIAIQSTAAICRTAAGLPGIVSTYLYRALVAKGHSASASGRHQTGLKRGGGDLPIGLSAALAALFIVIIFLFM